MSKMWFVYILRCADGDLYTGCTNNLEDRIQRHNNGYVDSTKDRIPVGLLCYTAFNNQEKAFAYEKYLKTGSGRAFKNKHLI